MRKKILVTGSSSGLGFAIAKDLNKKGYLVVVNGRNLNKLKKICEKENFMVLKQEIFQKKRMLKKFLLNPIKNLKVLMLLFVVWAKVNLVLQIKKNLKIGKKKCLNKIFLLQQILSKIQKNI